MIDEGLGNRASKLRSILSWLITLVAVLGFCSILYFDRHDSLSHWIRSYGTGGLFGAICAMTIICTTPIPSEGLLIVYMKVYGVLPGALYAWCGFVISSLLMFFLAKVLRHRVSPKWLNNPRFSSVEKWITQKGDMGLLIARLLPVPAYIVNFITGSMAITLWSYLWTGAVAIIPYYLSVVFVYVGISERYTTGLLVGVICLGVVWFSGYFIQKQTSS